MIDVTVDVSELSVAASGISGVMEGVGASGTVFVKGATAEVNREFGADADKGGVRGGPLAHVYEYGMEGTASGRLWVMNWTTKEGEARGQFYFRDSTEYAPVDSRLVADAAERGREISRHLFPKKAYVLETEPILTSVAGRNQYTVSTGGGAKWLAFWSESKDRAMFVKSSSRENHSQGNFAAFMNAYFTTGDVEEAVGPRMTKTNIAIAQTIDGVQADINAVVHDTVVHAGQGMKFVSNGVVGGVRVIQSYRRQVAAKLKSRLQKALK